MLNPLKTVTYYCRILKGPAGPIFEIEPEDDPGSKVQAGTATGAWSQCFKAANSLRGRAHSNSVSGPDYYGLNQSLFKALLQELPGASELSTYVPQVFVESQAKEPRERASLARPAQTAGTPARRLLMPPIASHNPNSPNYDTPQLDMHPSDAPFPFLSSGPTLIDSDRNLFFDETMPFAQSYASSTEGYAVNAQGYAPSAQPYTHLLQIDPDPFPPSRRDSFEDWATPPSYSTSDSDLFDAYQLPSVENSLNHDFPFEQS